MTSKAKGVKLVCSLYVIPLDEDLDLVDREPSCLSGYSYKTQTKEEEVKLDHAVHQFSPRGDGRGLKMMTSEKAIRKKARGGQGVVEIESPPAPIQ